MARATIAKIKTTTRRRRGEEKTCALLLYNNKGSFCKLPIAWVVL
jgi:hypothetical protein